jgi:hypothetical protein
VIFGNGGIEVALKESMISASQLKGSIVIINFGEEIVSEVILERFTLTSYGFELISGSLRKKP